MRILIALTVFAVACGGTKPKQESALVNEGSDQSPTCCCKTIPLTDEKDITPVYAMQGRMECSGANGECVDEVQCANSPSDGTESAEPGTEPGTNTDGVPPPPDLGTDSSATP
jgi:hypothetical protein